MGPQSKDAVVAALGHLIDELLQQREVGRQTLIEVKKLARRVENQASDHEALTERVATLRRVDGNGNGNRSQ